MIYFVSAHRRQKTGHNILEKRQSVLPARRGRHFLRLLHVGLSAFSSFSADIRAAIFAVVRADASHISGA